MGKAVTRQTHFANAPFSRFEVFTAFFFPSR